MKVKITIIILAIVITLASCASNSVSVVSSKSENSGEMLLSENTTSKKLKKELYKGKGIDIAVLQPEISEIEKNEEWISQYFQDSLTTKLSRFSKMTVLDRKNENLIKAEQELSESGYYSEENAVQIGQLTNAQIVVIGSIRKIEGSYEVNFRANDVTTNEIRASTDGRYSSSEIRSGKAVNAVAKSLLEGLGIEFTNKEKAAFAESDSNENESIMNLAKGNSAKKNDNIIEALAAYSQVGGKLNWQYEAESNSSQIIAGSFNVDEFFSKIYDYSAKIEHWNKIFSQLEEYMNENSMFIVYDFSKCLDKIDMNNYEFEQNSEILNLEDGNFEVSNFFSKGTVDLEIFPGVKCVPNAVAMKVWATVMNEWKNLVEDRKNNVWTKSVSKPVFGAYEGARLSAEKWVPYNLRYVFVVNVGLFDDEGYLIKKFKVNLKSDAGYIARDGGFIVDEVVAKPQRNYLSGGKWETVYFNGINVEDLKHGKNFKVIDAKTEIFSKKGRIYKNPLAILSIEEYMQKYQ